MNHGFVDWLPLSVAALIVLTVARCIWLGTRMPAEGDPNSW